MLRHWHWHAAQLELIMRCGRRVRVGLELGVGFLWEADIAEGRRRAGRGRRGLLFFAGCGEGMRPMGLNSPWLPPVGRAWERRTSFSDPAGRGASKYLLVRYFS